MESTTAGPPVHRLRQLVHRIRARLGEEAQAGWWSMTDADVTGVLEQLHALSAQVDAALLSAVREVDRRDLGRTAGATSTATWLSGRLRVRPEHASRTVKLAAALDAGLPATAAASRAGRISVDHAGVIARAVQALPAEAGPVVRGEAERMLVDQAAVFDPKDLTGLGRTVLNAVDPDLADRHLAAQLAADETRAERSRELALHDDPHSTSTWVRGRLDPVTTEMLRIALEPLSAPMPSTADGPDLRNHSQRLGDGLAELLRRYLDSGASPTHAGEKPHLIITTTADNLHTGTGTATLLHTGTPISIHTAQPHTCDATISHHTPANNAGGPGSGKSARAGNGRGSGHASGNGNGGSRGIGSEPKLSDGVRLFTGKLRRLLELRDRGCAFPGCNRPPPWCHAHHITPYSQGGPTTLTNGVLLCGHHHRLIHQGHWKIHLTPDHTPQFTPPDWIDPHHTPLRNHRIRR